MSEPGYSRPADVANDPVVADDSEFARMDSSGDGRVSAQEYAASDRSAVDRIAEGKRNGPGGASGGFSMGRNEGRPERSALFQRLDTDRDGFLNRSELDAPHGRTDGKKR